MHGRRKVEGNMCRVKKRTPKFTWKNKGRVSSLPRSLIMESHRKFRTSRRAKLSDSFVVTSEQNHAGVAAPRNRKVFSRAVGKLCLCENPIDEIQRFARARAALWNAATWRVEFAGCETEDSRPPRDRGKNFAWIVESPRPPWGEVLKSSFWRRRSRGYSPIAPAMSLFPRRTRILPQSRRSEENPAKRSDNWGQGEREGEPFTTLSFRSGPGRTNTPNGSTAPSSRRLTCPRTVIRINRARRPHVQPFNSVSRAQLVSVRWRGFLAGQSEPRLRVASRR